jgi:hypothetical protein
MDNQAFLRDLYVALAIFAVRSFALFRNFVSNALGPRFTRAQIEQSMRETNSVEMYKGFGVWDLWQSGHIGRQK